MDYTGMMREQRFSYHTIQNMNPHINYGLQLIVYKYQLINYNNIQH